MGRVVIRTLLVLLAVATAGILLLPVLVVVPMSFSDTSFLTFPPRGLSLRWFENFFADPSWMRSALASLRVALLVTALAVLLGTAAAFGLVRGHIRFKAAVAGLVIAPLIVPYVIIGLAAYAAALQRGLTQTTLGFVLIHTALAVPYVTINVAAALASYDTRLEHAAMSLGATRLVTFFRVTLPIIAPSVGAGALFAFVTSWDEVVVSLFLSGPGLTTLPVRMWSGVRIQIDPTVAAVSTMLLLITVSLLFTVGLVQLLRRRRLRRTA